MLNMKLITAFIAVLALLPASVLADTGPIDLTGSMLGIVALGLFIFAYMLVMAEEKIPMAIREEPKRTNPR